MEKKTDASTCPTCGNGRNAFCECADSFHYTVASPPTLSVDEAAKAYADSHYSTNIRSQHTLDLTLTDRDANEICQDAFKAGAEHQARQEGGRKTLDELIKTIQIDWSNMDHIRKFGVINGTLKSEIIRVAETHAKSKVAEPQHPHIEATSENLIGRVKDRFKELKGKEFDWRSFYHGWIEGRADWNFKKPTTNN